MSNRVRMINVIDNEFLLFKNTYALGIELANWLNSDMSGWLVSENPNSFDSVSDGSMGSHIFETEKYIKNLVSEISELKASKNLYFSIHELDLKDKPFITKSFAPTDLTVIGYNDSIQSHVFIEKVDQAIEQTLVLVPQQEKLKNITKILVPFEPQYVTQQGIKQLSYFVKQIGAPVEFLHINKKGEVKEAFYERNAYENVFDWVDSSDFSQKISFRFPLSNSLYSGIKDHNLNRDNTMIAVIDSNTKEAFIESKFTSDSLLNLQQTILLF